MANKSILISIGAVLLSFIGGFLLANMLNRSELDTIRSENERLKRSVEQDLSGDNALTLKPSEIENALNEASKRLDDPAAQKRIGLSLYLYSSMKQDQELLQRAISILERAFALAPEDPDVMSGLANAYFDDAFFKKDNTKLVRSRELYEKVLAKNPKDAVTITNLGLTYSLQQPPAYAKAEAEYMRALAVDPKQEKALQFLVQALIKQNKDPEAAKYLGELKTLNPGNTAIPEFTSELAGVPTQSAK
mgnify:CR=1 FL=1